MSNQKKVKQFFLPLILAMACIAMAPGLVLAKEKGNNGIIYAEPQNLSTNIPLEKVLGVSEYFHNPENMVKIQFPTDESKFAWVNMSKYYPTAQVMREGQASKLSYDIDLAIGEVAYKNRDGKMLTVNEHFDTKPIDAMIVVKNGKIVYERLKTMRPNDKHIWYSVSKVTGATMLAFLEYEGKVDVSRLVSQYLQELKGSEWDTVKVEEALDMATGLNGTEHDEAEQNSRTDPDQIWFRWAATDAVGIVSDVRKRGCRHPARLHPPGGEKSCGEVISYHDHDGKVFQQNDQNL